MSGFRPAEALPHFRYHLKKKKNVHAQFTYFFFLFPELPSTILLDVLELCLSWDHFRCHHNPTECLALELWRVFYHDKLTDIHISHHAFAFPKTTNYPDIVTNVQRLLEMLRESPLDQTWVSYTQCGNLVIFLPPLSGA